MSTQTSSKHYFLTLIGAGPSDKPVKTYKDEILNVRIKKVPNYVSGGYFLMDKPNDSLVCDLEINAR